MLYNREDIDGHMGKSKGILFCYNGSFVMFLNAPVSFISRNE